MDESKSSADRRTDYPEVAAGDPFAAASGSKRVAVLAADITSEACERCGAVADLETDDGTPLCGGCAI